MNREAAERGLRLAVEECLRAMIGAVERYLDNPGCNVPAQKTAQERLRWALNLAKLTLGPAPSVGNDPDEEKPTSGNPSG